MLNQVDIGILLAIGLAAGLAFRSIRRKGKGCSWGCPGCTGARENCVTGRCGRSDEKAKL